MNIDLSQFYQVFFDESAEHLAEMEQIFLAIDPANPDDDDLNAVFRAAHSIKGGAGTFGFLDMTVVSDTLETLLDRVRHREIPLTRERVDVFLQAGDAIKMQLAGHRDGSTVDELVVEKVCEQLSAIFGNSQSQTSQKSITNKSDWPDWSDGEQIVKTPLEIDAPA